MKKNFRFIAYILTPLLLFSCATNLNILSTINGNNIENRLDNYSKFLMSIAKKNTNITKHNVEDINISISINEKKYFFKTQSSSIITRHKNQAIGNNINIQEQNIFDPKDLSKMSSLETYKNNSYSNQQWSSVTINNNKLEYQDGIFAVYFKKVDGLRAFQSLYNATIINSNDDYTTFSADLSKAPLSDLENLIKKFNVYLGEEIKDINFSSLRSAQTFTILIDWILKHPNESYITINFKNGEATNNDDYVVNDKEFSDEPAGQTTSDPSRKPDSRSWWFKDTNTEKAWHYSIGTGTKIAVIEVRPSYKTMNFSKNNNIADLSKVANKDVVWPPEINRRVIKEDYTYDTNPVASPEPIPNFVSTGFDRCLYNPDKANENSPDPNKKGEYQAYKDLCLSPKTRYHSHLTLMAGFAEKGNKFTNSSGEVVPSKSFGIAPNAKIMPLIGSGDIGLPNAILEAVNKNVDAIGINFELQSTYKKVAKFLSPNTPPDSEYTTLLGFVADFPLLNALYRAKSKNIPVVVAAANRSWDIKNSFPYFFYTPIGNVSLHPIIVGSINKNQNNGQYYVRGNSNIGKNMIWAAGSGVYVSNPCFKTIYHNEDLSCGGTFSSGEKEDDTIEGTDTSIAMPQVLGTVALMKSRNPFLTDVDVFNKLRASQSSAHINNRNGDGIARSDCSLKTGQDKLDCDSDNSQVIANIPNDILNDIYLLDIEKAVKSAIDNNELDKAKSITGRISCVGDCKTDKNIVDSVTGDYIKLIKDSVSDDEWDLLKQDTQCTLLGWMDKTQGKIVTKDLVLPNKDRVFEIIANKEKGFEILNVKINSFILNSKSVPVVGNNTKTPVVTGDKFAVPATEELKQKLQHLSIATKTGQKFTYYEIVNDYAILGVDTSIPNGTQSIIMKDLLTGNDVLTFEDALYKTAMALNLNPQHPPGAKPIPGADNTYTTAPPFIYHNSNNDQSKVTNVETGDIVATSVRGIQPNDNVTVTIGNATMPIYDRIGDYVAFHISSNAPSGLQNVTVNNGQGSVTLENTVNISNNLNKKEVIIFSRMINGKSQICLENADGTGTVSNLSNNFNANDSYPRFSDNFKLISFIRQMNGYDYLFTMNIDGTNQMQIGNAHGFNTTSEPVLSPDNTKLAVRISGTSISDIYQYDYPSGNNETNLTNGTYSDFSPNYVSNNEILSERSPYYGANHSIVKINSNGDIKVLMVIDRADEFPSIAHDKSKFVFYNYENSAKSNVAIENIDGSGYRLIENLSSFTTHPRFSPDGNKVVCLSNRSGINQLWVLDLNNLSNSYNLTNNILETTDLQPDWGIK